MTVSLYCEKDERLILIIWASSIDFGRSTMELNSWEKFKIEIVKGQLILKCPFGVFKSPKKNHEIFSRISALASKKRSNQKNKDTLYR